MPELAEIKLMSDFINESHNFVANYETVAINPSTKVKTELSCLTDKKFRVRSESRGKELRVSFFDLDGKTISPNGNESLYFAMGMSGNWLLNYQNIEGIERILFQMNKRTANRPGLQNSIKTLRKHHDTLENYFFAFFESLEKELNQCFGII
jgi:hypothetical protein